MSTYTLYFVNGQTYTDDFLGLREANKKGRELAMQDNTMYLHAEKIEAEEFWFHPVSMG